MIFGICDRPDRVAARIFVAMRSDCPCCEFWRRVVFQTALDVSVVAVVVALVFFIIR